MPQILHILTGILMVFSSICVANAKVHQSKVLVNVPSVIVSTPLMDNFIRNIYKQLFQKQDLEPKFTFLPAARGLQYLQSGQSDMEAGRVHRFGWNKPGIIRASEPWLKIRSLVVSHSSNKNPLSLMEIMEKGLSIGYIDGTVIHQAQLLDHINPAKISKISPNANLLQMIALKRIPYALAFDFQITNELFKESPWMEKVQVVQKLKQVPFYAYFSAKNPKLAEKFKSFISHKNPEFIQYWRNTKLFQVANSRPKTDLLHQILVDTCDCDDLLFKE